MKTRYFFHLSIVAFLLLLSCEEVVTPPEIREIDNLLVVNGILNPTDSIYEIEVTWSNPSFGLLPRFDEQYVRNAQVTITNGADAETFTYEEDRRIYRLSSERFPIRAGLSYQLNVVADGREVSASVTTKSQVPEVESYEIRNDLSILVQWKDVTGTEDYYSVNAYLEREEIDFTNRVPYFFESGFISDGNRDGTILQDIGEGFDRIQEGDSLAITIYSFDEIYVDYFRILENFIGDDPFSEPTQLPSNIEGGLGIFAIVQQSDLKVKVQ